VTWVRTITSIAMMRRVSRFSIRRLVGLKLRREGRRGGVSSMRRGEAGMLSAGASRGSEGVD